MRVLMLSILIFTNQAVAATETETINLVKSLIPSLGQPSDIKTAGCAFKKEAWTNSLLTQKSFQEKIVFNKNCDLQGSYQVAPHKFFPLNYKIQGHKNFNSISSTFKYGVVFEDKPTLRIEMKNAVLKGKKLVKFTFLYEIYVNPIDKDPLAQHKGGKIYIDQIDQKKIGKSIPVKFN